MQAVARAFGDIHSTRVLSLDSNGRILDWISWQDATCLYVRDAVAWTLGDSCLTIRGGTCRETGSQSLIRLHPIVASRGHARPGLRSCPVAPARLAPSTRLAAARSGSLHRFRHSNIGHGLASVTSIIGAE